MPDNNDVFEILGKLMTTTSRVSNAQKYQTPIYTICIQYVDGYGQCYRIRRNNRPTPRFLQSILNSKDGVAYFGQQKHGRAVRIVAFAGKDDSGIIVAEWPDVHQISGDDDFESDIQVDTTMARDNFEILGRSIAEEMHWADIIGEGETALTPPPSPPPPPVHRSPGAGLVEIMKKHYGPLPGWGWGALAAGIFIGAAWIFPSRRYY